MAEATIAEFETNWKNKFWLVKCDWEGEDHLPRFITEGIWTIGSSKEFNEITHLLHKIKPGDIVLCRSNPKKPSDLKLRRLGIVRSNSRNFFSLRVDWLFKGINVRIPDIGSSYKYPLQLLNNRHKEMVRYALERELKGDFVNGPGLSTSDFDQLETSQSEVPLVDELEKVDRFLKEFKQMPKLSPEKTRELQEKYRLEWNFHSNHIEGNTLTYGQTQLLLLKGLATGDHEKQEFDEIEAHDLAIEMIREWAIDKERDITETDLRELNRIILVRPFWKDAITPDGGPTRKKILPGAYKSSPNSVRLKNGQIYHYASTEETPALMEQLFKWYSDSKNVHPIIRAATAHHRLTQIHPFDDGNGRVARLLVNYILLREGYPPFIVRSENKDQYLNALAKADVGDFIPLIHFFILEMSWSFELTLRASRGEKLDDKDDLEKRISIIDSKLSRIKEGISVEKSPLVLQQFISESFIPLSESIKEKTVKIEKWFNKSFMSIYSNDGRLMEYPTTSVDFETLVLLGDLNIESLRKLSLQFRLEGARSGGFNSQLELWVEFFQWFYEVRVGSREVLIYKLGYDKQLEKDRMENLTTLFVKQLLDQIERQSKGN